MADTKLKCTIKSDGTSAGTTLLVNGADITHTENVTSINFSAYSDGSIWAQWTVVEKGDNGIEKRQSYSYQSPATSEVVVKQPAEMKYIGQDSILHFETDADEKAYKIAGSIKTIKDSIEILDLTKENK